MKKTVLILIIVATLASCTTLPNPQDKEIGLFVIPYGVNIKDQLDFFGAYRYTIEGVDNDYKTTYIIPIANGSGKLALKPGKYKISKKEFIYKKNGEVSRDTVRELNNTFTIEEGQIKIFKIKSVTNVFFQGNDKTQYYMNLEQTPLSMKERLEIQEKLKTYKNSEFWEF